MCHGAVATTMNLQIKSSLVDQIKVAKVDCEPLQRIRTRVKDKDLPKFKICEDGSLRFRARVYMLTGLLRKELLKEAHSSPYSSHSGVRRCTRIFDRILMERHKESNGRKSKELPRVLTSEGVYVRGLQDYFGGYRFQSRRSSVSPWTSSLDYLESRSRITQFES